MSEGKEAVAKKIESHARAIYDAVKKGEKPVISSPVRSLSNVTYNLKDGFFELKGSMKTRTLSASTVKGFAQTLLMMSEAKKVVETDDIMTKREAYYVSKNWSDAKFNEQPESDTVMDDIEAMMRVLREELGFIPEEDGGAVAGNLVIIDQDPDSGDDVRIDCTKFASGAYSIPSNVEHFRFETDAKFVLAVETAGMFQRLVKHKFYKQANCVLVSLKGVPSRATRRFIKRLSADKELPVYVFTDGDPYGYGSIYRTLKVGSGNAAHVNEYFCVPHAKFIGVTPQDIEDYKLPSHPLKDVDVKKIKDLAKNDPFIKQHKEWQQALTQMAKMKVRAEQQALAKWGLNYVIDTYLPEKLKKPETWLP